MSRVLILTVFLVALVYSVISCQEQKPGIKIIPKTTNTVIVNSDPNKVVKTEKQWQSELSKESFYVTRQKGTEPSFTGKYNKHYKKGVYLCICCDAALFDSKSKFDSGTGWPSFYDVVSKKAVGELEDNTFFSKRIELVCNRCDAHLGHVFPDGPKPTGLRYCINSVSLKFKAVDK